tara:strand:- start:1373 stop:1990 length:618 start_codon:yes stop_codon:yes gene_type:complete
MALNGSGPISLGGATTGQSINLELGQSATAQVSLNDANVRSLAGVPSGAISVPADFWGKSSVTVALNPFTWDGYEEGSTGLIYDVSIAYSSNVVAGVRFGSDGNVYAIWQAGGGINYTQVRASTDWVRPTSEASNYYVKGTPSFGTFSVSPGAGYFILTSDIDYYVSRSTIGFKSCSGIFYISGDGTDGDIVDSIGFTVTAEEEK